MKLYPSIKCPNCGLDDDYKINQKSTKVQDHLLYCKSCDVPFLFSLNLRLLHAHLYALQEVKKPIEAPADLFPPGIED